MLILRAHNNVSFDMRLRQSENGRMTDETRKRCCTLLWIEWISAPSNFDHSALSIRPYRRFDSIHPTLITLIVAMPSSLY